MNDIINYSNLGIEKITEVGILDKKEQKEISGLKNELQRVFEVKQQWRTETEIKYSVLNDVSFPTNQAKYYQSIREQDVFFQNLCKLSCEYEIKQGELELSEIELSEIDQSTKKGKAQAKITNSEIRLKRFELLNMRFFAKDRVREIILWEKIKNELTAKEDFDINDCSKHQKESYKIRWQKELEIASRTNNATVYKNSISHLETMEKENE